jgi:chemotaxis protein methyltransferase CheR
MCADTHAITDADFSALASYMKDRFGINLDKKRTLVEGRLSRPMAVSGFDNFHDYLNDSLTDKTGKKVEELVVRLTTNYTYFMREEVHYAFLRDRALPEWTARIKDGDLRIWSAGCSSGEEAYTVAMTLDDYFGSRKAAWDSTVLATDISLSVLEKGRRGVYPVSHLEYVNDVWRKKFFVERGDACGVTDALRKEVVFSQFNLMQDFTRFRKRFHVIFCRNVMIYFDAPTKAALADKFQKVLEPGGYLFIGLSETLSGIYDGLRQISPSIYKKGG